MPTPENVAADGVADPVAADIISGVAYQRVKASLGVDGTAVDWPGDGTNGAYVNVRNIQPEILTPKGYTQITSLSSAVGIGTVPSGATVAIIQAEAQTVRWRDDGTSPTASVGSTIAAGDSIVYGVSDFSQIKFIQTTTSAIINVAWYA